VLILGVLAYFSDIVMYIILAWVVSMIGAPLMGFLKKYLGKTPSALITLFTFVIFFLALIWVFIPPLVNQTRNLAGIDYNKLINSLEEPINDWNQWLIDKGLLPQDTIIPTSLDLDPIVEEPMNNYIERIELDTLLRGSKDSSSLKNIALVIHIKDDRNQDIAEEEPSDIQEDDHFFDRLKKNIYSFLNPAKIPKIFGSIVGFFGNFAIAMMSILFISFFFLKEQGLFIRMLSAIVPDDYEYRTIHAVDESSKLLIRYFIGIVFQITIITLFVSLILSLLGIKNALLIGFFAALMNVIPYLGPILGASFGIIITISSNIGVPFYDDMLPMIVKLIMLFVAMQLFDNFIVQPTIFGKSVKAHPLEIFIIVLVGAKLGGVIGMVLAIPIYTVIRVLAKVFLSEFKIVQKITKSL
jgi:predicted PurR-regulated permease PerM